MINNVQLIGRFGKSPELKETSTGLKVATVSLATTKKFKDKEETQWHNLVAFNKAAESMAKYCAKGRLAYISGEIRYEKYEKNGETKYMTKIVVDTFRNLEWGNGSDETEPRTEKATSDEPTDYNF